MPPPRQSLSADSSSSPPPWMKFAFGFMCALLVVVTLFGWEQWEDARRDYAAKQYELKIKTARNADAVREKEELEEFLFKYANDPIWRGRMARQRLQYVAPGEVILRMEPPSRKAPSDAEKKP